MLHRYIPCTLPVLNNFRDKGLQYVHKASALYMLRRYVLCTLPVLHSFRDKGLLNVKGCSL